MAVWSVIQFGGIQSFDAAAAFTGAFDSYEILSIGGAPIAGEPFLVADGIGGYEPFEILGGDPLVVSSAGLAGLTINEATGLLSADSDALPLMGSVTLTIRGTGSAGSPLGLLLAITDLESELLEINFSVVTGEPPAVGSPIGLLLSLTRSATNSNAILSATLAPVTISASAEQAAGLEATLSATLSPLTLEAAAEVINLAQVSLSATLEALTLDALATVEDGTLASLAATLEEMTLVANAIVEDLILITPPWRIAFVAAQDRMVSVVFEGSRRVSTVAQDRMVIAAAQNRMAVVVTPTAE